MRTDFVDGGKFESERVPLEWVPLMLKDSRPSGSARMFVSDLSIEICWSVFGIPSKSQNKTLLIGGASGSPNQLEDDCKNALELKEDALTTTSRTLYGSHLSVKVPDSLFGYHWILVTSPVPFSMVTPFYSGRSK